MLALGTCHDSGGFCAESFSGTHVLLYSIGVLLLSAAAGVLAAAIARNRPVAFGIAAATGVLLLALIVVAEATG
jgi:uncharacterized membrane protein (DUF485 family)